MVESTGGGIRSGISKMRSIFRVSFRPNRADEILLTLVDGVVHEHYANEEFADLTDFKLRSFRYPI